MSIVLFAKSAIILATQEDDVCTYCPADTCKLRQPPLVQPGVHYHSARIGLNHHGGRSWLLYAGGHQ